VSNFEISIKSRYQEVPATSLPLLPESIDVDVNILNRYSITVPPKVGNVPGEKTVYLPTGYFTDPADTGSWVNYSTDQVKLIAFLMASPGRYVTNIDGESSIENVNTLSVESSSAATPKLVFDSPIFVVEQEGGVKFSDFFGTEVPHKVTFYNAHAVENDVEILHGLTLD
jgi:hypothetical protein